MVSAPKFSGENLFATPITSTPLNETNLPSRAARPAMDPKTYPEWQASLLKQLVSTTKAASAVGSHDVSFERSIDSKFNSALTSVTDRLLALSNRLLKFAGSETEDFEDEDDLEDRWAEIVDVVDGLLERAVFCPDSEC
jgi:hypothetical protein